VHVRGGPGRYMHCALLVQLEANSLCRLLHQGICTFVLSYLLVANSLLYACVHVSATTTTNQRPMQVHGDLGRTTPSVAELLSSDPPGSTGASNSQAPLESAPKQLRGPLRGVCYPRKMQMAPEADILQLDVVDVMMPLAPAVCDPQATRTAAARYASRSHIATKHGGDQGVFRDSDDEDEDDVVADSDTETAAVTSAARESCQAPVHDALAASSAATAPPQKSRSQKAVGAKMLNLGV
jgi:hypothetical protein